MTERLERVKGTSDLLTADWTAMREIRRAIEGVFESFGYDGVDVPVVEPTDLYLRKAGGEQIVKMYSFVDQGGRKVSLRPEFTASIIRLFVDVGEALPLPVRWHYSGPVFRYERPQRSRYRQFTQQGVELLGAAGPAADAEVVQLACRGFDSLGVAGYRVVLGHVGLAIQLLDGLGLSDRLKTFLLGSLEGLGKRSRGPAYVRRRLGELFQQPPAGQPEQTDLAAILSGLSDEQARVVVNSFLHGMNLEFTGSRTPDEIAARFMHRFRRGDEARQIDRALDFIARLAEIVGPPPGVFDRARDFLRAEGLDSAPLDELAETVELLGASGVIPDRLTVDFGLARGLAYYTGMVFEIYPAEPADAAQLCGGGRYDGLVRALGGRHDVPALGFAYGVERLRDVLGVRRAAASADVLVAPDGPSALGHALRVAAALRAEGLRVEVDPRGRSRRANLEDAARRGIGRVALVDATGAYTVRDLATGAEEQKRIFDAALKGGPMPA